MNNFRLFTVCEDNMQLMPDFNSPLMMVTQKKETAGGKKYEYHSDTISWLPDVRKCVCGLRSAALDEPWIQTDVSDVMSVQQPGEEPLQSQTVTTMRTRAILPLEHTHSKHTPFCNPADTTGRDY